MRENHQLSMADVSPWGSHHQLRRNPLAVWHSGTFIHIPVFMWFKHVSMFLR
jgi:hypothetical protein